MTRRRLLALGLAPVAALSLAGCQFGSSPQAAATTVTAPAPPTTVAAPPTPTAVTSPVTGSTSGKDKSFSVVVPTGWKDVTPSHKTTVMFLQAEAADGRFYPTFNVIRQTPTQVPALGDVVQQGEIALRQAGASVSDAADRSIGGLPAKGYVATRTVNGTTITQTQYFVIHDNAVYTTTMSADASRRGQSDQTQNSILGTWAWAPGTGTAPASSPSAGPSTTPGRSSTPPPADTAPGTPSPRPPAG